MADKFHENRVIAALEALTLQVSRLAWAAEITAFQNGRALYEGVPCANCGSQLVVLSSARCSACLEPKKAKANGQ